MSALAPPRATPIAAASAVPGSTGDTAQATPEIAAQPTRSAAVAAQASSRSQPGHFGVGRWPATFDDRSAADRGAVRRALHQQRSELAQQSARPGLFTNGSYRVATRQAGQFAAIGAPIVQRPGDVVVTATSANSADQHGGGYGIIVRDQGQGPRNGSSQDGRYYVLEVGDKGEVGIWRRDGDHWVDLLPVAALGRGQNGYRAQSS